MTPDDCVYQRYVVRVAMISLLVGCSEAPQSAPAGPETNQLPTPAFLSVPVAPGDLVVAGLGPDFGYLTRIDPRTGTGDVLVSGLGAINAVEVTPNGDVLLAVGMSVIKLNPSSGAQEVVSILDFEQLGFVSNPISDIAIDAENNLLLAVRSHAAVVHVNVVDGTQRVVSYEGILSWPVALAIEGTGAIVVAESGSADAIVRIDPTTGSQTVVSNVRQPTDIVLASNGNYFVAVENLVVAGELQGGAVLEIEAQTGSQRIIAMLPEGKWPRGVALDADGSLYVVISDWGTNIETIIRIDPATGEQSVVSDDGSEWGRIAVYRSNQTNRPLEFDWPLLGSTAIGQDFNCFSCLPTRPDWFHTGVDLCLLSGCAIGAPVRAAASGEVVLVRRSGHASDSWCDNSQPYPGGALSSENRGFGNVVVIRHSKESTGLAVDLYSLYGHLDCIADDIGLSFVSSQGDPTRRVNVNGSALLGRMGQSSQGWRIDPGFPPHVHFEIKSVAAPDAPSSHPRLLLGREDACSRGSDTKKKGCVGYTPDAPADRAEYVDPNRNPQPSAVEYLDPTLLVYPPTLEEVLVLKVIGPSGVNLRPAPGHDRPFNELPKDVQIVAFGRAPRDGQAWYQVHLVVPHEGLDPASLNDGIEGWLTSTLVEKVDAPTIVTVTKDDAEILEPGDIKKPSRIGRAWKGQRFAVIETDERAGACEGKKPVDASQTTTWYRVFVGNLRLKTGNKQTGWICSATASGQ